MSDFAVACRERGVSANGPVLLPETTCRVRAPALIALTGANGTGKSALL